MQGKQSLLSHKTDVLYQLIRSIFVWGALCITVHPTRWANRLSKKNRGTKPLLISWTYLS